MPQIAKLIARVRFPSPAPRQTPRSRAWAGAFVPLTKTGSLCHPGVGTLVGVARQRLAERDINDRVQLDMVVLLSSVLRVVEEAETAYGHLAVDGLDRLGHAGRVQGIQVIPDGTDVCPPQGQRADTAGPWDFRNYVIPAAVFDDHMQVAVVRVEADRFQCVAGELPGVQLHV